MISFSVAVDPNLGIGINGSLPWHIKEELQLFKANTLNKNIQNKNQLLKIKYIIS